MGIEERQQLATEGIVVAAVDIVRSNTSTQAGQATVDAFNAAAEPPQALSRPASLRAQIRVTTQAMWVDSGRLLETLHKVRGLLFDC